MIVVSDASPLIFLAKLDRLHLLPGLFGTKITVLQCVSDEVLNDRAGLLEKVRLRDFLKESAEVVSFEESDIESNSLSASDQYSLTYCERHHADWLIADERLLRRVARAKGISTMGFLGILIQAVKAGLLTKRQAKRDFESVIGEHDLRISIVLYQRILREQQ
jgi:predicted nucleic acid-binding protein